MSSCSVREDRSNLTKETSHSSCTVKADVAKLVAFGRDLTMDATEDAWIWICGSIMSGSSSPDSSVDD
eukprot:CAMPEP_0183722416 /NCGR_PEP_ID=MMETSP0737-20130205/14382_1 /TAXON_ID=385413 /ORGANISM="Thalassiosira miniscula, Strain CCMP1093" /LENGTH=67 /DNA_ID=CAMNT_0025952573 /DNA_START=73 /DNA_END=273 /DNA_ORIENTATION=+